MIFLGKNMEEQKTPRKVSRVVSPTGIERMMGDNDIIVSKTDKTGRILYCNEYFMQISGFEEKELIGSPHSILRHPDMPRALFQHLWKTLMAGNDIFAYIVNLCKNGDHYWVLAHVSPSFDGKGNITGYHSMRRKAYDSALHEIKPIYKELLDIENSHPNRKTGLEHSYNRLLQIVDEKESDYDEFILSI